MSYEDYPKSAQLLFNATIRESLAAKARKQKNQKTRQDNSEIRRRRARVEEIKNKQTYGGEE